MEEQREAGKLSEGAVRRDGEKRTERTLQAKTGELGLILRAVGAIEGFRQECGPISFIF